MDINTLSHMPDFYRHSETERLKTPVWDDGTPIPWMTYPAISYLNQLDFSRKQIFEYGCGASTRYWARRAKSVISVEHDETWYHQITANKPANSEIFLLRGREYAEKVAYKAPHDVIVVDGRWRFDSSMFCVDYLCNNGMIILDNSERHPVITEFFRKKGFIEVDMIGYGPQNRYIWSTSIFFSRNFDFQPARDFQPHHGPGMFDSFELHPEHAKANEPNAFD